ncbi:hypothetical protein AB0F52_14645 [Amycolatopsis sp. NPDC024027]|uniref:hypothetical protein n=1 Tax=Amycolatopsis sp. NPDC024027 TaxID=3154327 RepID=UPI0033D3613D
MRARASKATAGQEHQLGLGQVEPDVVEDRGVEADDGEQRVEQSKPRTSGGGPR